MMMCPLWFAAFVASICLVQGFCTMRGQCDFSDHSHVKNCFYNGTAKALDDDQDKMDAALAILETRCPEFLKSFPDHNFCCNADQVNTMTTMMELTAGVFSRCPTCSLNLFDQICRYTCHPDQGSFMSADKIVDSFAGPAVWEVSIYTTNKSIQGIFDSCSQVLLPSSGGLAMDAACGPWGAAKCTADRWFTYMGNPEQNPFVPMLMKFLTNGDDEGNYDSLDTDPKPCSDSYEGSFACACVDCLATCTTEIELPPPK